MDGERLFGAPLFLEHPREQEGARLLGGTPFQKSPKPLCYFIALAGDVEQKLRGLELESSAFVGRRSARRHGVEQRNRPLRNADSSVHFDQLLKGVRLAGDAVSALDE